MLTVNLFDINPLNFFCKKKPRAADVEHRIHWYCVGEAIFALSDV